MLIDNRNDMRLRQRTLLEKLAQLESKEQNKNIIIEPSKKGVPTMKIMLDGKIQYMHSKYDPEKEAEKLIDQIQGIHEYTHVLFIGAGIGYHINELSKRHPNLSLSIYEPNLDILYHFLSYQNITKISKGKLQKFITTIDEDQLRGEIQNLHNTIGTKTLVYTLPAYAKRYDKQETVILQTLKELLRGKRSNLATDVSFQKRWTINSIKNFPKVLETPNILHDIDKTAFKGKTGIIVAAGPSLNEEFDNLKFIKDNGLAYIFSVGSAINALIEHGIYPDAACTYDPTENNQFVFEKLKERNIKDIPLIFGSSVGFETLENYPGKMLHMLTNQDTIAPYYINNPENISVVLDAPSIAVITFQLLKMLGCSQIILVGQNLAFQNNSRYAEGIDYDFVKNELSEQEKEGLLTVKNVYGDDIQTNDGFNRMRQQLEMYIKLFSDLEVINTTKGGAQIEGTVFVPLTEMISDKWAQTNNVTPNWFDGTNSYDLIFTKKQINTMQSTELRLDQAIQSAIKELRDINTAVNRNQTKELDNKFRRFDKEIDKMKSNPFFKAYIEPMVRVHNNRLSEESQAIRFETNLIKKGHAITNMFASFLMECQAHVKYLIPYIKEFKEQIDKLTNK